MKKVLTKISVCLLFVFVMFSGIVLSACGENNENATLTLSTKNVEVLLGETENNTVSVRAYVDNASDSTVTWDCDETSLRITSEKINSRVTELSVTALKICDIDVTVSAAGKNAVFHVSAITPVKSISATTKKLCASYDKNLGGTFSLSSDLVVFSPQETGQKGLRYELANSVAGVSIVDNVLTLAPNIQNLPSSVWVDVISTAKENVRTSVNISIVPTIEVVAPYIQIVETQDGSNVRESYNLARNSQVENVLELSVYVANRENGYRILPRVKFENSNTGLVVNEIIQNQVSKNATYQYDGYVYDFKFSFDKISSSMGDEDNMCFEFYYEQFEGIMSQSEKINITTYDEVTKLAYVVGGLATEETLFDVYTSYPKGVNGLSFEFNALPTTARERDITLVCDSTKVNAVDINGNNIMVDGEGNVVNEIVIPSGTVVYFSAKDSNLAATQFTVKVKAGDSIISKTITLLPSIGLSEMNFYENGITVINPTYYLESQEGGQNSRTLYFYVKPANVSPEDLAITIVGNGFDIDTQKGVEYVEDVYGDTGEVVGA
ncbi:MAG: hypothetical protein IJA69_03955, partial [Clostridia bacterium]|nr:hypothetical protein [Clostridia bacterium]